MRPPNAFVFQFSMWDSWFSKQRLHLKYGLSILYVRFLEPPEEKLPPLKIFQFSMWDSENLKANIPVELQIAFNSLCEIHPRLGLFCAQMRVTFNSLCEIPVNAIYFTSPQLYFQFSMWDSEYRHKHKPDRMNALSILYVRFSLDHQPAISNDVGSFNSLCEIPNLTSHLIYSDVLLSILYVRFD